MVLVIAVPTRPVTICVAGVMAGAAAMVILTVAVAMPLVAPVAVTVWSVALCVAVGVPLMTPLLAFRLRPAGRAGLMV